MQQVSSDLNDWDKKQKVILRLKTLIIAILLCHTQSLFGQKTEIEKSWEVGLSKPMFSYVHSFWFGTDLNTNLWPGLIVRRTMERIAFTTYVEYHENIGNFWIPDHKVRYANVKASLHTYLGKKRLKFIMGPGIGYSNGQTQFVGRINNGITEAKLHRASIFLDLGIRYEITNKLCITVEAAGNLFVNLRNNRSPNTFLEVLFQFDYFPVSHFTIAYTLPPLNTK
jgi:hypothetical protein